VNSFQPELSGATIGVVAVGLAELLAGTERLEAYAAQHLIPIPPRSRLDLYISVVRGLASGRPAHLSLVDVGGAMLEVRQLATIVDGLNDRPELAASFKRLLRGKFLTLDAPVKDEARDLQFELYVAARLALSGLRVELLEPDIVVHLGTKRLGVAAKRPRSAGGLKSAIEKGGRQLRANAVRGFLALDASMYPLPDAQLIAAMLEKVEDVPRAASDRLHAIASGAQRLLGRRLLQEPERSGALGVLLHLSVPFFIDRETHFTAAVGEAWLALPAKFQLRQELAAVVSCLGSNAKILALAPARSSPTVGANEPYQTQDAAAVTLATLSVPR
jgi:hypothetical protein